MPEFSPEILERVRAFCEARSNEKLSLEDCREVAQNLSDLFKFLHELHQKYGKVITSQAVTNQSKADLGQERIKPAPSKELLTGDNHG